MINKKLLDKAVRLNKRQAELLEEMKASAEYSECEYELNTIDPDGIIKGYWNLIRTHDGKFVASGSTARIKSFLRIRGVNFNKVYNCTWKDTKNKEQ